MYQRLGRTQALVAAERLKSIESFAASRIRGKRLSNQDAVMLISEFDAWYSKHTRTCPKSLLCVCPPEVIQATASWSRPVFSTSTSEPSLASTRPAQTAVRYRVVAAPATPPAEARNETSIWPCAKRLRLRGYAEDALPPDTVAADTEGAPRLLRCPPGAPPPTTWPQSSTVRTQAGREPSGNECGRPTVSHRCGSLEIWRIGPEDSPQG